MSPKEITELKNAIRAAHGCESLHVESVPVKEVLDGETAWDGTVEVFDLVGHPKANRAYAWSYRDGEETKSLPYCESRLSIRPRWPSKWRLQQRQKNTEWPLFRPRAKNGNYCSGRVIATAMFSLLELRIVYDSPIIFKPVIYPFFEFLLTSGRRTL